MGHQVRCCSPIPRKLLDYPNIPYAFGLNVLGLRVRFKYTGPEFQLTSITKSPSPTDTARCRSVVRSKKKRAFPCPNSAQQYFSHTCTAVCANNPKQLFGHLLDGVNHLVNRTCGERTSALCGSWSVLPLYIPHCVCDPQKKPVAFQ